MSTVIPNPPEHDTSGDLMTFKSPRDFMEHTNQPKTEQMSTLLDATPDKGSDPPAVQVPVLQEKVPDTDKKISSPSSISVPVTPVRLANARDVSASSTGLPLSSAYTGVSNDSDEMGTFNETTMARYDVFGFDNPSTDANREIHIKSKTTAWQWYARAESRQYLFELRRSAKQHTHGTITPTVYLGPGMMTGNTTPPREGH